MTLAAGSLFASYRPQAISATLSDKMAMVLLMFFGHTPMKGGRLDLDEVWSDVQALLQAKRNPRGSSEPVVQYPYLNLVELQGATS